MWGVIGAFALSLLSGFLGRILATIGFGFVVYQGVKPLYDNVINQVKSMLSVNSPDGIPIMEWLGVLRFDVCLSILISGVSIKLILMGLNASGGITKTKVGK